MRAFLRRLAAKVFSPVCQDKSAIIYSEYGDAVIRFRPVVDTDGVVTDWIPDPDAVERMEMAKQGASASAPPALPTAIPAAPPPTLPAAPAFNPAGVVGL